MAVEQLRFVDEIAAHLLQAGAAPLHNWCVVLPNKRAGLFLQQALAQRLRGTAFMPTICTPEELWLRECPLPQPDQLELVLLLYEVYRALIVDEPFEQFYPWGQLLLADFAALEMAMAPAQTVFADLAAYRALDEVMPLNEDELGHLRQFWDSFSNQAMGRLQQQFLHLWQQLPQLYVRFTATLAQLGLTTTALQAQRLALSLDDGQLPPWPFQQILFAGLNALGRAEQRIIDSLVRGGHAQVLMDVDDYYLKKWPTHEAGVHARQHSHWLPQALPQHLGTQHLTIQAHGVAGQHTQAHVLAHLLEQLSAQPGWQPQRTAVVLPDESLLFAVLYALPEQINAINVTMGYPMRYTSLYSLLRLTLLAHMHAYSHADNYYYAYEDVTHVLAHPYLQGPYAVPISKLQSELLQRGQARVPGYLLMGEGLPKLLRSLFTPIPDTPTALRRIHELMLLVRDEQQPGSGNTLMEQEVLFQLYTHWQRLHDTLLPLADQLSLSALFRLLRTSLEGLRVPFSGEPLQGLQIMGFLETRALDFEHVFILSANEGLLPPKSYSPSFIPYHLRKAFGLPTRDDTDAVNAYHLYRLLQRARSVHLIYDNSGGSEQEAEPSRYLLQLQHELAVTFPHQVQFTHQQYSLPTHLQPRTPITVYKTPAVMALLQRYVLGSSTKPVAFSPSQLKQYVHCPLRFYYEYVEGMKEPDDIPDVLDKKLVGTVVHQALYQLYKPLVGQQLHAAQFETLATQVRAALWQVAEEVLPGLQAEGLGRNLLLLQAAERMVHEVLQLDAAESQLTILALEAPLQCTYSLPTGQQVMLGGKADRIDHCAGRIRVLDYKTGPTELGGKKASIGDLFEKPNLHELMQAVLYGLLYHTQHMQQQNNVYPGLVLPRAVRGEQLFMVKATETSTDAWQQVEQKLLQLLSQILDDSTPFVQTTDETVCKHCPFYTICYLT